MTRFANFYAYDTAEETPPEVILLHGGQTGALTSFVRKYSATFADINLEAKFKNVNSFPELIVIGFNVLQS